MIFVIGGREQGKTGIAVSLYKERKDFPENMMSCELAEREPDVADGRTDSPEAALRAEIVLHLESLIRTLMEKGESPEDFAGKLIRENPNAVVTADEIGYGIVPADAFEREYREREGRICQQIAGFSREVYRVVCGVLVRIK